MLAAMPATARVEALRRHPTTRRLVRFALASGIVQVVYAALMVLLLVALDTPRQAALAVGYAGALIVHFTVNRHFVFVKDDGYEHGLGSHTGRYVFAAAFNYAITAAALAALPGLLGVEPIIAWLIVTATLGLSNFALLGRVVFR
jgi:putative flippase GtrA